MTGQRDTRQIVLAILGASAGVAMLAGVIVLMAGGDRPLAAAESPLGWTVPIASLFVIGGVTWLLLSQTPRDPHADSTLYLPCGSCGRSVLRDWRLCPYCGSILERSGTEALDPADTET